MDRQQLLFSIFIILLITACSPTAQAAHITPTPVLSPLPEATMTATFTPTPIEPTVTPVPSFTPAPEKSEVRTEMTFHIIQAGETLKDIADQYHLADTSILSSNFELRPSTLAPGMALVIPPTDGFYYIIKEDDALPDVAHRFGVSIISILSWPENGLDPEIEVVEPGKIIFIPEGKNPDFDWSPPASPEITP